MKIIKNHAIQEGALLLLLCGGLLGYSLDGYNRAFNKDWTQSPFLFPVIMGGLLGLLGLLLLTQGIRSLKPANTDAAASHDRGSALRVLALVGLCLVYYAALSWLKLPYIACTIGGMILRFSTFELATLLFLAAMMFFMGVRKRPLLILVPIGTTLFISVMFRTLLHVILP